MKTPVRIAAVAGVIALVAIAAYLLPLARWTISLAEWARSAGWIGVALFVVVYVLSTVAALPGSILTLAAGFAYGPVWGLAVASPASVAGATCAFALGRTFLRRWAANLVAKSPRAQALDAAVAREDFKLVLLLRLSPLFPFNVLNYALSLSTVRPSRYVIASAIGMLPGTALYVYLGSLAPAAADLANTGGTSRLGLVAYGVGLMATIAVAIVATRAARRALATALPDSAA
ncbi:MAG TPA: TVP38/TMEM64 family protein [Vicinamibacterales bacterium]|nr:TVP38/TMEM64 family protein [Vicinamibacterales bacterium]